jgi:hypothetical protein
MSELHDHDQDLLDLMFEFSTDSMRESIQTFLSLDDGGSDGGLGDSSGSTLDGRELWSGPRSPVVHHIPPCMTSPAIIPNDTKHSANIVVIPVGDEGSAACEANETLLREACTRRGFSAHVRTIAVKDLRGSIASLIGRLHVMLVDVSESAPDGLACAIRVAQSVRQRVTSAGGKPPAIVGLIPPQLLPQLDKELAAHSESDSLFDDLLNKPLVRFTATAVVKRWIDSPSVLDRPRPALPAPRAAVGPSMRQQDSAEKGRHPALVGLGEEPPSVDLASLIQSVRTVSLPDEDLGILDERKRCYEPPSDSARMIIAFDASQAKLGCDPVLRETDAMFCREFGLSHKEAWGKRLSDFFGKQHLPPPENRAIHP